MGPKDITLTVTSLLEDLSKQGILTAVEIDRIKNALQPPKDLPQDFI